MRLDLLDILACPLDGAWPLEALSLTTDENGRDVETGFLLCPRCRAAFPVLAGIPHLTRGGLRRRDLDGPLFEQNRDALARAGADRQWPEPPAPAPGDPTDHDRNLMGEGDYWGRYLTACVGGGDRSILDCRWTGTHAPYLHAGVEVRDDRDIGRRHLGIWPPRLSRALRRWWGRVGPGRRALDVGCGGGQFGLEPAWLGMDVVGMDISLESLRIAREHARLVGLDPQYVYADPSQPPFRPHTFDLLMSKDALHHIPDVRECLARLDGLLKPSGVVMFYEHVGDSRLFARLRRLALGRLLPVIQRRYRRIAIPEVFREGSVHEDIGRDATVEAAQSIFDIQERIDEIYLYFEIERLVYFVLNRRRWPSTLAGRATYCLEQVWLALGGRPDHVALFGVKKPGDESP